MSRIAIKDASFPAPFASKLEYNSPVHGNWNIVAHRDAGSRVYTDLCLCRELYAWSYC